jgi:hypothetical protein
LGNKKVEKFLICIEWIRVHKIRLREDLPIHTLGTSFGLK